MLRRVCCSHLAICFERVVRGGALCQAPCTEFCDYSPIGLKMESNVCLLVGDEGSEVLQRLVALKNTSNSNGDSSDTSPDFLSLDTRYYTARVSVVSLSFDEASDWLTRAQDSKQRVSSLIIVFRPNTAKGLDEWDLLPKLKEINTALEHGVASDGAMKVLLVQCVGDA